MTNPGGSSRFNDTWLFLAVGAGDDERAPRRARLLGKRCRNLKCNHDYALCEPRVNIVQILETFGGDADAAESVRFDESKPGKSRFRVVNRLVDTPRTCHFFRERSSLFVSSDGMVASI